MEPLGTKEEFLMVAKVIFTLCEVCIVSWIIKLIPVEGCKMLHCSGSVWTGIVMNQHNALDDHPTLLFLTHMTHFTTALQ